MGIQILAGLFIKMGIIRKYFPGFVALTVAVGSWFWLDNYACKEKESNHSKNNIDKLIAYILKVSPKDHSIKLEDGTEVSLSTEVPGVRSPFGTSSKRYHIKVKGNVSFYDLNFDGFDTVVDEYLLRIGAREYLHDDGFEYDSSKHGSFKVQQANWKRNEAISDITSKLGL